MREILKTVLIERALDARCISYKSVADILDVRTSPIIATVTKLLEDLMDEDAIAGRPFLASLVIQKSGNALPRSGFFEKLDSLKVIDINSDNFDESHWHKNELEKLKTFYKNTL